ncbi:hypothetical protein C1924_11970 [Stenotrophomonas sp. ESTM1D_MKCIP4_1]|uniref:hypothetical protein n=1 Tax=Stenotrophomonas sp. ESTM1D_MKCIP4_1 TaxID=2072414 RepID=UPI000D53D0D2|nr:hypothetical protein [Stenotrophomonas sp. ESTM1D_MKCIP4_1]AWH53838.1 hypothetical protein C1924_11970 [Stenotrophomonas sp. ESTM1D_MKCIP4_1]
MSSMVKTLLGTQFLAALFGLSYFAVLSYRSHPDALSVGLRIWGYFALIFLCIQLFLALKQWWQWPNRRR